MEILDNEAMREADRITIEEMGVPSLDLMERAGQACARHAVAMLASHPGPVRVVCGKGNNGGDGLVIARLLHERGLSVEAWVLAPPEAISADARVNLERAAAAGVELRHVAPEQLAAVDLGGAALVVDALFGTGLGRAAAPPWDRAIAAIDGAAGPAAVLAVDLPSGLSGSSGAILGPCVRAHRTVALQVPKWPHVFPPAVEACGEVYVEDIGIRPEAIARASGRLRAITAGEALAAFAPRPLDSHKVTFGRLLLVAGSRDMPGAAQLAVAGALRGGAGLIALATVKRVGDLAAGRFPDVLHVVLPETEEGTITQHAAAELLRREAAATAALIGPGLSQVPLTQHFVRAVVRGFPGPLVVDADGLNALADEAGLSLLRDRDGPTVLTPHPGELRRLVGGEPPASRLDAARRLASRTNAVVVLKGYRTLVVEPDGAAGVCLTGGPALARGGTGDVLAGFLASILARGVAPSRGAAAAVYLHGLAGDLLAARHTEHMVPAGILAAALPGALKGAQSRQKGEMDGVEGRPLVQR